MAGDHLAEILRLRATVADLLALSRIPEACVETEPRAIAAELAKLLIGSLQLDFAFVRLCDPTGGETVEAVRGASWKAFPEWRQQRLAVSGPISCSEVVTDVGGTAESSCGLVIPIGFNGERGLVAAASDRADFPDQIDQQLLSIAVNNASTAVRNALLVDELRRVKEALRDSQRARRKARDMIDTIPAIVWCALPDGSNTFVNSRLVEYTGMSAEQMAGSGWQSATHPDDLQHHLDKWRASVVSGEIFENEVRVRRADGQYRWHLCRALRDDGGGIVKWCGVLTDIEDRKRAEQALQRSESYLTEAQKLSHTGSWAFNAAGFDYWSCELFRIHALDASGKAPTTEEYVGLVHPEDREFVAQKIQTMLADHRAFDFTKRIVRPDGEVRHVRCVGNPVTQGEVLQGFVGTAVDVTEQEQFEQERESLRQLEADLAHVNRVSMMGEMVA
jgi:PAS domain S-box-containing protein